ncbi:hypothetical protein MKEN_00499200 [Mycena kentingensis (nom. inval.)]|nr:hypothetical protein MKEN_00499200 [Mycena kentingensis (nom. inval.)]
MAALSLANFSIDDTLGAAFIGFAFSSAAFGVSTNQAITYFTRYPEDKIGYKTIVSSVWILSAIDQAFIGHAVYFYTITNYANPLILIERVAWTLIVQLTLGALIGTIVRLCFALRVWRFSQQNVFVVGFIVVLIFGELALAILFTVKCFQNPYLTILPNLKLTASLALGAGALTDVVIAGSLCYFLRQYRTGSKKADSLVTTLTVYAINTGAFTAAVGVLTLVFYDLRPHNFQFLAFFFVLSKLYAISFYCTLNTRRVIRGKGTDRSDGRSDGHAPTTRLTVSLPGRTNNGSRSAEPRTTLGTNTSLMYGYPTSAAGTSIQASSAIGSGRRDQHPAELEVGVHQEVSVISDVDESGGGSGSDVKARDYESAYGAGDSTTQRYSTAPSHRSGGAGAEKDEYELTRQSPTSATAMTGPGYSLPYAYSPPISPSYSHTLERGDGYGWGSAGDRGRKGMYAYGQGMGVSSRRDSGAGK